MLLAPLRISELDSCAAAIGTDDGAGEVAGFRRGEEGDDFGDLVGFGRPVEGGGGTEGVEQLAGLRPGVEETGTIRDALLTLPERPELLRLCEHYDILDKIVLHDH